MVYQLFFVVILSLVYLSAAAPHTDRYLQRARHLLQRVPLIDGHNDFAWLAEENFDGQFDRFNFSTDLSNAFTYKPQSYPSHTDLLRMRKGQLGGQFWSVFTYCDSQYKDGVKKALQMIDFIKSLVQRYSNDMEFVTTADGIMAAHQKGKIASMIGIEGGHMIDSSMSVLRMFYELGVRYLTLTWSCDTPWADNYKDTRDQKFTSHGLSDWGKRVVKEMNRLGMLVDLAHVAKETMEDALDVSDAPVIFSHSSSFAMCPHHRNVPDDVLMKLWRNQGIAMVNFYSDFINCTADNAYHYGKSASLSQVADHLDHIKSLIGVDHVGIGADFNGNDHPATGLDDTSHYPALFAELLRRGWSESELEKLAYRNIYRVFKAAENVAKQKQTSHSAPDTTLIDSADVPDQSCTSNWMH